MFLLSLCLSLSPSSQFPSLPFSFFLPSLSSNRCTISIMARKYSEQSVHFTVHFLVLTFGTAFPRDEVAGHKSPPLLKVDLSSVLYYLCQLRQEFCKTRLKTWIFVCSCTIYLVLTFKNIKALIEIMKEHILKLQNFYIYRKDVHTTLPWWGRGLPPTPQSVIDLSEHLQKRKYNGP